MRLGAALGFALVLGSADPARAEEYTRRSYALPEGSVEITGDPPRPLIVGVHLSSGSGAGSVDLPVSIYFGVAEHLTLGIVQDRGPCLGCDQFYNDAGLGAGFLYNAVLRDRFELELRFVAPLFQRFRDPFLLSARVGVLGRVRFGEIAAMVFDPSVKYGITNRRAEDGNNKEYLSLPLWFYFQVSPRVAPFVGTAFSVDHPLEGFFANSRIRLEGGVVYSMASNVDIGGVLIFDDLRGAGGALDRLEIGLLSRFRF
jgi:hypothetical protein